jgi:hypothetical protein
MQLVQQEYFEDVDEAVGYAYRYWELLLEIEGRQSSRRSRRVPDGDPSWTGTANAFAP